VSLDRAFITSTFFMGTPLPRLTIDETPCAQHCGKEPSRRIGLFIVGAATDRAINNAIRCSATQPNRDVNPIASYHEDPVIRRTMLTCRPLIQDKRYWNGDISMKLSTLIILVTALLIGAGGLHAASHQDSVERVILVTGATGTQGGAVARELLARGYEVRGLTRNTESNRARAMSDLGVDMVRGDFDDAESLAAAMKGVHGVFAVTNTWEHGYDGEVRHGRQLVDAALEAGVKHFVFTSVASADAGTGIPHFESKGEIEAYLRGSGMEYSVVRPVEFMDNLRYFRDGVLAGSYFDPRDSGKSHQWIAVSDIGFFVGEAFDNPQEWLGKTVEIAGDELTIAELVAALSRASGVDVQYQRVTWSDYEERAGHEMTVMLRWFDDVGYSVDIASLRSRYPGLLTYEQFLVKQDWD
jgi:uncharacterized protein YbjT (DUF2867 family)